MSWKRPNVKERMGRLLESLPAEGDGYWIDIGTGDGLFTHLLINKINNGKVIQTDLINYSIISQLHFKADLSDLPLRKKSLDGMVCAQVLHYINFDKIFLVLNDLLQKIKLNGHLLIIEYVYGSKYSWIPYPITEKLIQEYVSQNRTLVSEKSTIRDGDRSKPKYATLLHRIN